MNENATPQDDEVPVPLGLVEEALLTGTSAAQTGDQTGPWPYLGRTGAPEQAMPIPHSGKRCAAQPEESPEMEEVG